MTNPNDAYYIKPTAEIMNGIGQYVDTNRSELRDCYGDVVDVHFSLEVGGGNYRGGDSDYACFSFDRTEQMKELIRRLQGFVNECETVAKIKAKRRRPSLVERWKKKWARFKLSLKDRWRKQDDGFEID